MTIFSLRTYLKISLCLLALVLLLNSEAATTTSLAQSTFSKAFFPATIGPGSVSTLTFTITNNASDPATMLDFTDNLPQGVTIAAPANTNNTCADGILTAPDGGSTITYTDGSIPGSSTCTISVDVTSNIVGVHQNISGDLTSSAGNSGNAIADLTVDAAYPGFSKSFSPGEVHLGQKSTLTLTIDNTASSASVTYLTFTDNLPIGLEIADPANASTTCGGHTQTLAATSGTSTVSLTANGAPFQGFEVILAGETCTVTVDVVTTGIGTLINSSGELTFSNSQGANGSSGKANAALEVTADKIQLVKTFTDDPVPPGRNVTLEFNITNFDRINTATAIAFSDDLGAALTGLTFDSLLSNDCGGSVGGVGTDAITFSGGNLAPETFCTIVTSLAVPTAATPGAYTNMTNAITAMMDGSPITGNVAIADLFVEPVPILTKEFLEDGTLAPDPVINAGDDIVIRFTIENTSLTSGATDIAFIDELTTFLPFPVMASLPPTPDPPCGAGSSLTFVYPDTEEQGLSLTGGNLAVAPGAGSTCTFDVTITVPEDVGPGVYVNTTEEITAMVDGNTRIGEPASDTFTVIAAPDLTKSFIDDPVAPGSTVTMEFTLSYPPDASGDATNITFTDDLAPVLSGLTASLPASPDPPCGTGSSLTGSAGDTFLTLSNGTLSPGTDCIFQVTLDVPAGAASGYHTNTTSDVAATVEGLSATSSSATDDLVIANLLFSKEFIGDPALPNDQLTLRFTIENLSQTLDATDAFFTDNLSAELSGLAAVAPLPIAPCGGTLSGTTFLIFVGGSIPAGQTCSFDVTVQVPGSATDGIYRNTTSSLTATIDSSQVIIDPATDVLIVDTQRLGLSKSFTNDPVEPGDNVNLEFTINNLDTANSVSNIAFTDDLDAALSGLTFDSLSANDCGGTVSGTGTTDITFSGGSLGAGAACTINVTLTVPSSGSLKAVATNETSQVTGEIGGVAVSGGSATDDLAINTLQFSKAFDGPSTATGNPTLTFTITNLDSDNAVNAIAFADDLAATLSGLVATGLPQTDICGAGSEISGTSFLVFTGGNLLPGSSCSIDVPLQVPATVNAGSYLNTTSDLFSDGLVKSAPATATLVIEPPPTFGKTFSPDSIGAGQISTLVFTIDNAASTLAASSLNFTDNLPAGVVVATPANESATCGGTLTATAGTSVIGYSGGSVPAGANCMVSVERCGQFGRYVC